MASVDYEAGGGFTKEFKWREWRKEQEAKAGGKSVKRIGNGGTEEAHEIKPRFIDGNWILANMLAPAMERNTYEVGQLKIIPPFYTIYMSTKDRKLFKGMEVRVLGELAKLLKDERVHLNANESKPIFITLEEDSELKEFTVGVTVEMDLPAEYGDDDDEEDEEDEDSEPEPEVKPPPGSDNTVMPSLRTRETHTLSGDPVDTSETVEPAQPAQTTPEQSLTHESPEESAFVDEELEQEPEPEPDPEAEPEANPGLEAEPETVQPQVPGDSVPGEEDAESTKVTESETEVETETVTETETETETGSVPETSRKPASQLELVPEDETAQELESVVPEDVSGMETDPDPEIQQDEEGAGAESSQDVEPEKEVTETEETDDPAEKPEGDKASGSAEVEKKETFFASSEDSVMEDVSEVEPDTDETVEPEDLQEREDETVAETEEEVAEEIEDEFIGIFEEEADVQEPETFTIPATPASDYDISTDIPKKTKVAPKYEIKVYEDNEYIDRRVLKKGQTLQIGRHPDMDLHLHNAGRDMSRTHLILEYKGDKVTCKVEGVKGVEINGNMHFSGDRVQVVPGDVLIMRSGKTVFTLRLKVVK